MPQKVVGTGGRSLELTLAGVGLIVAGVGVLGATVLVSIAFQPGEIVNLGGIVFGYWLLAIGYTVAYLLYLRAGYPSRRPAVRILEIVAAVAYLLLGVIQTIMFLTLSFQLEILFGLVGIVAGLVGIAVGVFAAMNRMLPMSLRVLPLLLSGLTVFFGLFNGTLQALVPIVIGILFIVFARNTKPQIEAASRA